jgi:PST family polysaccharide transporter/lipopolysaccharide exporter
LELAGSVLSFVVTVAFAYWLRSVWALVYGQIASAAIGTALSFAIVPPRLRFRFDFAIAKELYRYGRFITGLAIVLFISRELDHALVGKLLGMQMLGYYVAANTLANLPSQYLSKVVAKVLFPMFSKLQGERELLRREYARGIRLVTVIVVPMSAVMVALAPEIVRALYGDRWAEAAMPLRILAIFGCFRALWVLNGYLYNAIGMPQVDFYVSLGRTVLMGCALYPLTRAYGLVGASLAVTVPMVLQFAAGVWLSKRFIDAPFAIAIRPLSSAVIQGAVLAIALLAIKSVVATEPRLALVLLLAVAGGAFVALNLRDIRTLLSVHRAP